MPGCSKNKVVNPYADEVVGGTKINLYEISNDNTQRWRFEQVEGGYVIRNVSRPGMCITASKDGNTLTTEVYTGIKRQIWVLESTTAPEEHTYGEWLQVLAPTCTEPGSERRDCTHCDLFETREVAPKGHSYSYAVTTAPTEEVGELTGTCATCGSICAVELPARNETDYTYTVVQEPTREDNGIGRYTWKVTDYGEIWFDVSLDKLGGILGDINGDNSVNDEDVIHLLWHTLLPNLYPIDADGDINKDGRVNDDDVIYLLWHTLLPDMYPL